jgi:choline dehydrogenase-like flavoprotein
MANPDVVVVGAGAGGLAAAWRLAAGGARVVLLEAGRHYEPQDHWPHDRGDFELHPFPYDPVADEDGRPRYGFGPEQAVGPEWDGLRSWNAGQGRFAPGDRRRYLEYGHVRGVGGSTLRYQGEAHRLHPDAFRMRSRHGVGADWPLSAADLAPYYDVAEERMGVAGPAENPWRPRTQSPQMEPHPLSYASRTLEPGFTAVGAHLLANDLAINSRWYDRRPPCNYCNACSFGCPIGDKASADVVFLPHALATGRLDLRPGCEAVELEVDDRGHPVAVIYATAGHELDRIGAPAFVLAAGAVETPRLLLASSSSHHPSGLGNANGQIGRNLTENLFWYSVGLMPEPVHAYGGVPIDGSCWDFSVAPPSGDWSGGFRLAPAHGALGLRGPATVAQRFAAGFGVEHQRRTIEIFNHGVGLLAVGEWLPNPQTYVDLDPSLRDRLGRPVARISSALGEPERELLPIMARTVREILGAAGVGEMVEETSSIDIFAATHTLGTCRMGDDSRESVTDDLGFCHDVPNLAIADGSVLPSSGSGDSPCLTITAAAIRTADALLDRRGDLI